MKRGARRGLHAPILRHLAAHPASTGEDLCTALGLRSWRLYPALQRLHRAGRISIREDGARPPRVAFSLATTRDA